MKRFILPLLIIFIFISLPAKANDEVKTLLKVLDKSLQNKASYTQQKQRQIDSLKIILRPVSYTHLTLPTICSV